jgi:hypothetical protein
MPKMIVQDEMPKMIVQTEMALVQNQILKEEEQENAEKIRQRNDPNRQLSV